MFAFRLVFRTPFCNNSSSYSKEWGRSNDFSKQIETIFTRTVLYIEVSPYPVHCKLFPNQFFFNFVLCRVPSVLQDKYLLSYVKSFITTMIVLSSFMFYVKHLHTRTTCIFTAGIREIASLVLVIRNITTTDTAWNSKQTALDFHSSKIGITNCM